MIRSCGDSRLVRLAVAVVVTLGMGASDATGADQDATTEAILSYDVTVHVAADGAMEVAEEIRVRALGDRIRRGIYRDFPTSFPRASGLGRIVAPFEVVQVLRDGAPETFTVEAVGGPARRGGVRVRVGRPDVFLDPGEYVYRIVYRTGRWIDHEAPEGAALYWNVTGNGWDFAIERATARVVLPAPVAAEDVALAAWTGPEGATGQAFEATFEPGGPGGSAAVFRTTGRLAPEEGLTVRVAFPDGVVAEPTDAQRAAWFRADWGSYVDAGLVVALVVALYLLMWHRVGVDPARGTITVRYEPPEGLSAAALGQVRERGYDTRQLTAALVSMAVAGAATIERPDGRTWRLTRTGGSADGLFPDEAALYAGLFGRSGSVTLDGASNPRLREGVEAFRSRLSALLERRYFVTNRRWFAAGVALSLTGLAALAWRARYGIAPEAWFLAAWLSFWTLGTGTLVFRVVQLWRAALSGAGWTGGLGAVGLTLFSIPFVTAEIVVGWLVWQRVPLHLVAAAVALGTVNVVFYHLLERMTPLGRRALDEIEGFRDFLLTTDQARYDRMQAPDRTLELFERYLPHAIALDAENEWAERFVDVLGAGTSVPGASAPAWYAASGLDAGGPAALASALGGSMASSLSASSSPPASSGGGGGGGGSSGGGGGGGGGGGW